MPGLHATWSCSCVGDKLYTHFCRVETDEDSPQGPEASLTSSAEPLADSQQQISLSDYEDGAPEIDSSPRVGVVSQATPTFKESSRVDAPTACTLFILYYIISLRMLLALNLLLQVDEKARKSTSVECSGNRLRTHQTMPELILERQNFPGEHTPGPPW